MLCYLIQCHDSNRSEEDLVSHDDFVFVSMLFRIISADRGISLSRTQVFRSHSYYFVREC